MVHSSQGQNYRTQIPTRKRNYTRFSGPFGSWIGNLASCAGECWQAGTGENEHKRAKPRGNSRRGRGSQL